MKASRPHDETMVELLREDAAFADEYLAASLEAIDEPGGREALLMALRQVAQAQGMDAVAERAGIQLAILAGDGLRLAVTRAGHHEEAPA